MKIRIYKKEKSWGPFRICLLNNTANPANLHLDWAELVVLRFNIQNSTAAKYSTYVLNSKVGILLQKVFDHIVSDTSL